MQYLTNLNLNQNELQNVVVQNLAIDPSSPKAGQFWFNTASSAYKFYDGTKLETFATLTDLTTALEAYQTKITATGILKGNGSGVVSAATAGTDYGYATIIGSTDPSTSVEGAVGQHYLNTVSGVEFVCKAVTSGETPSYTWVPVTVDISGKQDTITVTGIVKGDGAGNLSAAVEGTDFGAVQLTGNSAPTSATVGIAGQHYYNTSENLEYICTGVSGDPAEYTWEPVLKVTANKALISDSTGKVVASSVTATELGYLSGVTSSIQTQLDNIPKMHYLDGVSCTVADGATQEEINTAATAAISTAYSTPTKYDAVSVAITFTPSDKVKDGMYMYNGTAWAFQYYTTTGIQLANGTTAGLIQEADSNSDLTLVSGVATVNTATALRTARNITVQGSYNDGTAHTDGITATAASFDGSAAATIDVTAIKMELLDGTLPVSKGGTGKTSITEGNLLIGNSTGGFDEIGVDTTVTSSSDNLITSGAVAAAIGGGNVAHKFSATNPALTPVSGTASWTVTHNLGSRNVSVTIFDNTTYEQVMADIEMTSTSVVTIKINAATTVAADTYAVTVIG